MLGRYGGDNERNILTSIETRVDSSRPHMLYCFYYYKSVISHALKGLHLCLQNPSAQRQQRRAKPGVSHFADDEG